MSNETFITFNRLLNDKHHSGILKIAAARTVSGAAIGGGWRYSGWGDQLAQLLELLWELLLVQLVV